MPKTIQLSGTTGHPIQLMANYFKLCKVTDCILYQYHVDFQPEEDRPHARKAMLKKQSLKGGYLFDGMILYSAVRYPQPMVLPTTLEDGNTGSISITLTRQVNQGDHEYLQFFNVLMRKCLHFLDLQLVGRNFFDPHAKV
jgi:aubergine